ncbi:MAG: S1/P1 nuclease [Verrucomicrobiaceae bacterium]|nr:S1/P1 nuclease [Verrucomicrobiaceae bacterium]
MKPFLLFAALASFTTQAFAWAGGGHKTIALIAWEQLTPPTRDKVAALLARHPEYDPHFQQIMTAELGGGTTKEQEQRWNFTQAAIWPDHVRPPLDGSANPNEKYHHATWHYLDLPVYADAEAKAKIPMPKLFWTWKPGLPEFIEQRLTAAQVIDKACKLIPDTSQPETERAVLLCWLFHVAGDLHQPCHTAALFSVNQFPKGDRGGNSILLKDAPGDNLHAYWDNLLGDPGSRFADAEKSCRDMLADKALMQAAAKSSLTLDPQEWIQEGAAIAERDVYPANLVKLVLQTQPHSYVKNNVTYTAVGPIDLGAGGFKAYDATAHATARVRAVVAGLRLAKALEKVAGNGG